MISEGLNIENKEAFKIYGIFVSAMVFSNIIGAMLGDLIIGNRKSIITGCVIQALGAFSLCIPSITGLYLGLSLVLIGGGMYTPNFLSIYGKSYLNKTKLLDAGFTILYLTTNLGAFFGTLLIGRLGENYNWNYGFLFAGGLILFSTIPIILMRENNEFQYNYSKVSLNNRLTKILLAFLFVGIFWSIYQFSYNGVIDLQLKLEKFTGIDTIKRFDSFVNSYLVIIISIVVSIIWTYFYSSQFFKLTIGFLLASLSFGLLYMTSDLPENFQVPLFLIALLTLSISEIYILPVIRSILTKYSNPKYLAIIMSLSLLPTRILFFAISSINMDFLHETRRITFMISMITMIICSLGLIVYLRVKKDLST